MDGKGAVFISNEKLIKVFAFIPREIQPFLHCITKFAILVHDTIRNFWDDGRKGSVRGVR